VGVAEITPIWLEGSADPEGYGGGSATPENGFGSGLATLLAKMGMDGQPHVAQGMAI
jgi:hypothetical protein